MLERAESTVVKLLEASTSAGLDRFDYLNTSRGWDGIANRIDEWRRGDPVDRKELRSRLNDQARNIKDLQAKLRNHVAYPQLRDLLEEARKACGAAARGIPDSG